MFVQSDQIVKTSDNLRRDPQERVRVRPFFWGVTRIQGGSIYFSSIGTKIAHIGVDSGSVQNRALSPDRGVVFALSLRSR